MKLVDKLINCLIRLYKLTLLTFQKHISLVIYRDIEFINYHFRFHVRVSQIKLITLYL